eukprot:12493315-Heterocapsa_arctica.AAC.1
MTENKEWTDANIENNLLMTCYLLSTAKMKTERNYVASFGAVTRRTETSSAPKHRRDTWMESSRRKSTTILRSSTMATWATS